MQTARELRPGEWVRVRSIEEIRATLDAHGTLDGLPFMKEMERFAGRRARVFKRAERVCVEGQPTPRGFARTVFLDGIRCDGAAHEGCDRGCLIFWREAWLVREEAAPTEAEEARGAEEVSTGETGCEGCPGPARAGGPMSCQSTALAAASEPVRKWALRPILRELTGGNLSPVEAVRFGAAALVRKARKLARRRGAGGPAPAPLGLVAGEWVEVRPFDEIEPTLDARWRHRGLEFTPEMADLCGRRFRVRGRVDRIILEATGEARALRDTVILNGAECTGLCPRRNPFYWREVWLHRVAAVG